MSKNIGKIAQVIGPVVDIKFDSSVADLPNIYDALEITKKNGSKVILECQQHIGEDTVRSISMDSTDGLSRGMEVVASGSPILMPVGEEIKGRLFNVTGQAIDGLPKVDTGNSYPIHREPPKFDQLSTSKEILLKAEIKL